MLLPFESVGVEANWEFQMPRAANLLDYNTIADILITIDYTALNSVDYRQQVIQTLKPTLSADGPFSFCQQFRTSGTRAQEKLFEVQARLKFTPKA